MTKTLFRQSLVALIALAILLWFAQPFLLGLIYTQSGQRIVSPRGDLANFEQTATEVFEKAAPSVVYIFTERQGRSLFGAVDRQQGTGSGFVWDRAGHIITNEHVIRGATRTFVRFDSGEAAAAVLVGTSADHDLAVLRVPRPPVSLQPIPVGASAELKIGQAVFAIGNPFGLSRTLTTGIVSALDRRLPTASGREITGVVQTDAAINPGNSGGPLIDSAGRLIGVNTAIISGTGAYSGIGFAVPVDIVNRIVPQLITNGRPRRPGIAIQAGSEELSARLNVDGVIIVSVQPEGPAAKAGLRGVDQGAQELGDVIIAVDNQRVRTISELSNAFEAIGVGGTAQLTVRRNSQRREVTVQLIDLG